MSTDVENLLREGMERFTADLRAPAELTRRVIRRRRRELALRSVAGAAALTAGAVALVAVMVPGARYNSIDTTAYVVQRVNGALSAVEPGAIAQMTLTTRAAIPGSTPQTKTTEEWSYGDQWRSITYSPAGHPVYDEGISASGVYTVVGYHARTWARQPGLGRPAAPVPGPRGYGPPTAAFPLLFRFGLPGTGASASMLPSTVASALHAAVSSGTLAVVGRQRVDGIEAIKLTSRPGSPISETIWVSPGTYLPVRVVGGVHGLQQTADITWLPPTTQNLAKLTVPIPAGFRQVPLAEAVKPIPAQIPPLPLVHPQALCVALHGLATKDRPLPPAPVLRLPPPMIRLVTSCPRQPVGSS